MSFGVTPAQNLVIPWVCPNDAIDRWHALLKNNFKKIEDKSIKFQANVEEDVSLQIDKDQLKITMVTCWMLQTDAINENKVWFLELVMYLVSSFLD